MAGNENIPLPQLNWEVPDQKAAFLEWETLLESYFVIHKVADKKPVALHNVIFWHEGSKFVVIMETDTSSEGKPQDCFEEIFRSFSGCPQQMGHEIRVLRDEAAGK